MQCEILDEECKALLEHLDASADGQVKLTELISFASLPLAKDQLIEQKLRAHFRQLASRGVDALGEFVRLDSASAGSVSRRSFEAALSSIGIAVVDEPRPRLDPRQQPDWDGGKGSRKKKLGTGSGNAFIDDVGVADEGDMLIATGEEADDGEWKLGMDAEFSRRKALFKARAEAATHATAAALQVRHGEESFCDFDEKDPRHVQAAKLQAAFRGYHERANPSVRPGVGNVLLVDAEDALQDALSMVAGSSSKSGRRTKESTLRLPDLRAAFRAVDVDGVGFVSRADFGSALRSLDIELTAGEEHALARWFDVGSDGNVDYERFSKFALYRTQNIGEVVEALQGMLHLVTTRDAFEHFDHNSDGLVTRAEFKRGLSRLGFNLSVSSLRSLMVCFDLDGNGEIDYASFVQWSQSHPLATAFRDAASKLRGALSTKAVDVGGMRAIFAALDQESTGLLTLRDFSRGLHELNLPLSSPEVRALFFRFDTKHSGAVSFIQFVEFLEGPVGPEADSPQVFFFISRTVHMFFLSL